MERQTIGILIIVIGIVAVLAIFMYMADTYNVQESNCPICANTTNDVSIQRLSATPGTMIPLQLKGLEITTSGLVITPSWKPAYVKWYLFAPNNNIVYMVESTLDSVTKVSSGLNTATWSITENTGTMKIPAFAESGEWTLSAKLYDVNKIFIIQWSNKAQIEVEKINVQSSVTDSFSAPLYIFLRFSEDAEFALATPDLIILIGIIVILIIIILNIRALRAKKS